MRFHKYEGAGNDFLVLLDREALTFDPAHAPRLCDRHFGVGADGVLLVLPPTTPGARATMRVINADGSEPEMCGNGLRCVALALHQPGVDTFVVDTGAGAKACTVHQSTHASAQVTLEMGAVRYLEACALDDLAPELHVVDAGNPHAILFAPFPAGDPATLGRAIEHHPRFPARTNVELAELHGERIRLRVWERGVGFTLACGTGACATAVAAWHTGRVHSTQITVELPGGDLQIERTIDSQVRMTGPARHVFSGDVTL